LDDVRAKLRTKLSAGNRGGRVVASYSAATTDASGMQAAVVASTGQRTVHVI
jgi:hypothetical protein